ncbi:MAG TPA: PEGA domain-containing protein [Vicinamibacterales bacterium]|nr:PEGA domain-containing protein [Vicinamibacterales bacterium]
MPANDDTLPQNDGLIQAAHAASSWVRARRATWTSGPEAMSETAPEMSAGDFEFLPAPVATLRAGREIPPPAVSAPILPVPSLEVPPLPSPDLPPDAAGTALPWLEPGSPARRWLVRGVIAAALLAATIAGARYFWSSLPAKPARPAAVEPKPVAAVPVRKGTGALRVSSTPPGAQVLVDGKARGVTPLTITDVSTGNHEVALQSDAGTVTRTVSVSANATAAVDEAIFSGFVTVYSPFEVTVSENGRVLRADDRHQIMLTAGAHELKLVNRALGYEVVRQVDVKPGDATTLQLTPDPSSLTVTASDAAEVWLDGTRLGDTPMSATPVPLGVHEIVVKRAAGGERRFNVTISAKPFTLNVDF